MARPGLHWFSTTTAPLSPAIAGSDRGHAVVEVCGVRCALLHTKRAKSSTRTHDTKKGPRKFRERNTYFVSFRLAKFSREIISSRGGPGETQQRHKQSPPGLHKTVSPTHTHQYTLSRSYSRSQKHDVSIFANSQSLQTLRNCVAVSFLNKANNIVNFERPDLEPNTEH